MKNLLKIGVAILLVIASTYTVQAQIENPVKWSYTAKKISADVYELYITATIQAKWHLYAQQSGEGPVPTKISIDKSPLLKLDGSPKEVGKLIKEYDSNFKSTLNFYANKVNFVQRVKIKAGVTTIAKGKVTYMVCNDEKCLPPKDVAFAIKVG